MTNAVNNSKTAELRKIIRDVTKVKNSDIPTTDSVLVKDTKNEDPKEIANQFNEFNAGIENRLQTLGDSKKALGYLQENLIEEGKIFNFKELSIENIRQMMSKISKKAANGVDDFPVHRITSSKQTLVEIFQKLALTCILALIK